MTRPRVHVLTPHVLPGDAVSRDVLGMAAWFRRRGHEVAAYAEWVHPACRQVAQPIGTYERHLAARDDLVIYHHSGGWPLGLTLWTRTRNRRVLKYHNITPARFFQPYYPRYADSCREGQAQTAQLLRLDPELVLADSEFNVRQLNHAADSSRGCQVVPPFHALDELEDQSPDRALAGRLRGATNLLFVGRVAPNKGHRNLIRVVSQIRRSCDRPVRLFAVGGLDANLRAYHDELQREITARGLEDLVHFSGKVSARQLATYFRCSHFFVCLSEHEGFCVPLVEAMAFHLPIVAYGSGAIPSTLGDQGLHWEALDPMLIVESILQIQAKPRWRETLIRRQREHYERHFATPAVERILAEALGEVLEHPLTRKPGEVTARDITPTNGIADAGNGETGRSLLHDRNQPVFQGRSSTHAR
jgi:glycosyltransferase involved in cell wall biosynthesis